MEEFVINDWNFSIDDELVSRVKKDYAQKEIMPNAKNIFRVFELLKEEEVKVVFLGQDPYPKRGDANGIAFSVDRDFKLPASLQNMYKELETDLGIKRTNGDLTSIVKQGVLFMNTVLTVEVGKPKSHSNYGWQKLTTKVILDLSKRGDIIFVLLGGDARKMKVHIDLSKNIIIEATHPSPLSAYRGFFGSKIFSQINNELTRLNNPIIDWSR